MFVHSSKLRRAFSILSTAAAFALVATAVGLFVGFSTYGELSPRHVFIANIVTGAFFAASGIYVLAIPSFDKKSILEDSTTYVEISSDRRNRKNKKGYDFLFLGLAIGAFGVIFEFVAWLLV